MINLQVPHSDCPGILWPALPTAGDAAMLALNYQLTQTEWWPADELARMQLRQLTLLVAHAEATVPFYKEQLQAAVKSGQALGWDDWRRIPILRRGDIQTQAEALVSRAFPVEHGPVGEVWTSGSTGSPISVKTTGVTGMVFQALNLRYHQWHGRDFSGKVAAFKAVTGAHSEAGLADQRLNWVPGYISGPMYCFDLTRPLTEQLNWLIEQDPDYLLVTPSVLKAILERCRDTGFRPPRLRQVSTINETLDPEVRELCEQVWAVPVADVYSAEEVGLIALQCPDHPSYHVQAESLLVEILDADGNPSREGQIGRVVLTDLHNFATPLIRYEIGDYAEVGPPCSCGRGLPVINRILGRSRNMLTLPSGDKIWPKLPSKPLLAIGPIRQLQVIQRSLNDIEVKLVADRPLGEEEERQLDHYFTDNFHHSFSYTYLYVDEIPRSASGKFESFKSDLDD